MSRELATRWALAAADALVLLAAGLVTLGVWALGGVLLAWDWWKEGRK